MSVKLKIVDAFWTFQGEGANAGRRALFVRLPFCNLKCSWCDTEFNEYKEWSAEEFATLVTEEEARFAVITGGEPLLNKQTPYVMAALKSVGFEVACETNGTVPPPITADPFDFITVSPKRFSKGLRSPARGSIMDSYWIDPLAEQYAHEFKYVVDGEFDFEILRRHNVNDGRRYSLSPEFGDMAKSLAKISEYIKKNPGWRVSLQTHKWMGVK